MKDIGKGFIAEFIAFSSLFASLQRINVVLEFILLFLGLLSSVYGFYKFFKVKFNEKKNSLTFDEIKEILKHKNDL